MADNRLLTTPTASRLFLTAGKLATLGAAPVAVPSLSIADANGTEGATIQVRVTRSFVTQSAATFSYLMTNGTAVSGTDYAGVSGTGTIPAGVAFVDIPVTLLARAGTQGTRSCTMTISNALQGATPLAITRPTALVSVLDATEAPTQSLSVASLGPTLEGTTHLFRITAAQVAAATITVNYATSNGTAVAGTDYTAVSGSGAAIPAGQSSVDIAVQTTARIGYQGGRTLVLTISNGLSSGASVPITTAAATGVITDSDVPTGNHVYWDSLVADPAFVPAMSNSFRSQSLINGASQQVPNNECTYGPSSDPYPAAKDAMKVVITAFADEALTPTVVFAPMDATQLYIDASNRSGDITAVSTAFNGKGRQCLIGSEVVLTADTNPLDRATGRVTLKARGAYGTTPVAHAAGAAMRLANSNLGNQVRPPLGTTDGFTYLFTWDWAHTKNWQRCQIATYKTFQFSSDNGIWLEPQNVFPLSTTPSGIFDPDLHVGYVRGLRLYNRTDGTPVYADNNFSQKAGYSTGLSNNNPITPYFNGSTVHPYPFLQHPDRWTRMWVRIKQQAADYDLMDCWVADEQQAVVQLYGGVKIGVRGKWNATASAYDPPEKIDRFWVEFNTSNAYIPEGLCTAYPALGLEAFRDLISYVKNFATLRWPNETAPASVASYLVQPEPEV